jgi:hypothetical protein
MASLLPEADAVEFAGAYGVDNAERMNYGLAPGDEGWFEDFHALTTPWGFDPGDITVPVELWHGDLDRMVPVTHGQGWPGICRPPLRTSRATTGTSRSPSEAWVTSSTGSGRERPDDSPGTAHREVMASGRVSHCGA